MNRRSLHLLTVFLAGCATGEDSGTMEDVYEPYLIKMGFLQRTPRGRVACKLAYEHLNLEIPKKALNEGLFGE